ncbi:YcdB/YcdC domain-containing protein [Brevibacillus borstelensis]|uniref:YcdB/YcdC domain-containing protein n=1 Tax=Brevibacillus borstelensis TaxID=45462 RepID=UPI0030BE8ED3
MKPKKFAMLALMASLAATVPLQVSASQPLLAAGQSNKGQVAALMNQADKALEQAKKMLPYLEQYSHKVVEPGEDGQLVVVLQQSKDKPFPRILLFVDGSTGEWKGFRRMTGGTTPPTTYSQEKAIEKATDFMKKWYGDHMGDYQYNPTLTISADSIIFSRAVNGVPFQNESIMIDVDNSGEIVGKSAMGSPALSHDKYAFPKPEGVLSKEQAEKELSQYLHLQYETRDGNAVLRYAFAFSGELDAKTGKDAGEGSYRQIIKVQPRGEVPVVKNAAEGAAFLAKQGIKTEGATVKEDIMEKLNKKSMEWTKDDKPVATVVVDTKTDSVLSFENRALVTAGGSKEKKLTAEQALQTAIKEIEKYLPKTEKEVMLFETPRYMKHGNTYRAEFALLHEGIPVREWRYEVSVDAETGEVVKTSLSGRKQVNFPKADQAISPAEAAAKYVKEFPLTLVYTLGSETEQQARLVYKATDVVHGQRIDAASGAVISWKE